MLIEDYEKKHYPIEAPDPIEAIKIRMEEMQLKQMDLIKSTGLANNDSDIDLLIVKNIPENNIRDLRLEIKLALWTNLNSLQKHFDIIVDSEERIQQRILMGDLFYKEIYTNGTKLYV